MKIKTAFILLAIGFLTSCSLSEQKKATTNSNDKLDRTILPIQQPEHEPITELDARDATTFCEW